MIIYRTVGRAELWPDTGMVFAPPIVDSSLSRLQKRTAYYVEELKDDQREYSLMVQKLLLRPVDQAALLELFADDDPTALVEKLEIIARLDSDT